MEKIQEKPQEARSTEERQLSRIIPKGFASRHIGPERRRDNANAESNRQQVSRAAYRRSGA